MIILFMIIIHMIISYKNIYSTSSFNSHLSTPIRKEFKQKSELLINPALYLNSKMVVQYAS